MGEFVVGLAFVVLLVDELVLELGDYLVKFFLVFLLCLFLLRKDFQLILKEMRLLLERLDLLS